MTVRMIRMSVALASLSAACAPGEITSQFITDVPGTSVVNSGSAATRADATLHDAAGAPIGMVQLVQDGQGRVHITVHAKQLTPGLHGMHLHAVGACNGSTTPAFSSAGGHFNPTGKQHGHHNPAGHHSGDLPNLEVNADGVGRLNVALEQFGLADLFDADGTALVIHANEDDLLTDSGPSGPGNSGARIACGVIQRS